MCGTGVCGAVVAGTGRKGVRKEVHGVRAAERAAVRVDGAARRSGGFVSLFGRVRLTILRDAGLAYFLEGAVPEHGADRRRTGGGESADGGRILINWRRSEPGSKASQSRVEPTDAVRVAIDTASRYGWPAYNDAGGKQSTGDFHTTPGPSECSYSLPSNRIGCGFDGIAAADEAGISRSHTGRDRRRRSREKMEQRRGVRGFTAAAFEGASYRIPGGMAERLQRFAAERRAGVCGILRAGERGHVGCGGVNPAEARRMAEKNISRPGE